MDDEGLGRCRLLEVDPALLRASLPASPLHIALEVRTIQLAVLRRLSAIIVAASCSSCIIVAVSGYAVARADVAPALGCTERLLAASFRL